jgi:hypothetical protein
VSGDQAHRRSPDRTSPGAIAAASPAPPAAPASRPRRLRSALTALAALAFAALVAAGTIERARQRDGIGTGFGAATTVGLALAAVRSYRRFHRGERP